MRDRGAHDNSRSEGSRGLRCRLRELHFFLLRCSRGRGLRRRAAFRRWQTDYTIRDLEVSKRCKRFSERGHWVCDERREAEIIEGENEDGMDVVVNPSGVSGEDGYDLGDWNELSRLRLGGCLCHNCWSITAIVQCH